MESGKYPQRQVLSGEQSDRERLNARQRAR